MFGSCLHRKVVKGSGVGGAECVVHVDVHEEWVMLCQVAAIQWLLSMADMVCFVCKSSRVHEQ